MLYICWYHYNIHYILLYTFFPPTGYNQESNISFRIGSYVLSGDLILVSWPDYMVYCVQSAGCPLGRLNGQFVTILSVITSYTWTELCCMGLDTVKCIITCHHDQAGSSQVLHIPITALCNIEPLRRCAAMQADRHELQPHVPVYWICQQLHWCPFGDWVFELE